MEIKFRTLKADEIDCRIAQISKTGSGMFLLMSYARIGEKKLNFNITKIRNVMSSK